MKAENLFNNISGIRKEAGGNVTLVLERNFIVLDGVTLIPSAGAVWRPRVNSTDGEWN